MSSIEGQYLGPTHSIIPAYIGDLSRFFKIISWVFSFVLVRWQGICFLSGLSGKKEKNDGFSSPQCSSRIEKFIVLPSSLGGVPVLSLFDSNPKDTSESVKP